MEENRDRAKVSFSFSLSNSAASQQISQDEGHGSSAAEIGATAAKISQSPTLLVELYDLQPLDRRPTETEWVQMARWIKYEEDIEGVDQHWGRPHVPFLSYHALHQLAVQFNEGVILLDIEAYNFHDIACAVTEALCERYDTTEKRASAFLETLQRKFRRPAGTGRKFSTISLSGRPQPILEEIDEQSRGTPPPANQRSLSTYLDTRRTSTAANAHAAGDTSLESSRPTSEMSGTTGSQISKLKRKLSQLTLMAMKSTLDENVEAAQVFAGTLPEVNAIRFGMVRLKPAALIPECHETAPVRFIFIILGPPLPDVHYHDLGRAIATLMSNQAFREIAYAAENRDELMEGLQQFMDCSVVIPPGEIETKDLINVDDVRKALRHRKQQWNDAKKQQDHVFRRSISHDVIKEEAESATTSSKKEKSEGVIAQERWPWERTGRPFGGMIQDFKKRAPYYLSDFKDALHLQCISSIVFMFFVIFSPAISFGQVMNQRLEGHMGITEVFVAQFLCGLVWGLFSGQPLLVQAATGPFLVFESALFQFCKTNALEFLVVRVWVSLWTFLLSILMVLVEASFLIGYVTRFTQDIFTTLIAGIFVYESGKFVIKTFQVNPLLSTFHYCSLPVEAVDPYHIMINDSIDDDDLNITEDSSLTDMVVSPFALIHNQPNTALLSMMFVIGTFYLAYTLKKIRTSHYFGRTIRKALGDFGVPVSILIMVMLSKVAFPETYLQMADMPDTFGLTDPSIRPWFIHPMGVRQSMPTWIIYATIVPAILISILLFAEIEIVELLLFSKDRGLKKPMGFHWDLILCGGLMFISSLFGLPWMCAAAVQSLTHATSLTIMKRTAPGEKPAVDYVVEQRVTTIIASIMIGACSFLGTLLSNIPIAVLLGVFLYLGVSCLMSIQFIHRLILLIVPRKYFPEQPYCKEVSMWRMHAFTLCQLIGFVALWVVNIIPQSSLAFPFVIALDAAARRYLLPRIFVEKELQALDPSDMEKPPVEKESEDIYDETSMPM